MNTDTDALARRNVFVLVAAQAILGAQMPMIFTIGGLAGGMLGGNPCFATLPISAIVFGSMIQILATLLSPTIAGEGAREAFQALLLSKQLDGVAPAVLSGALGFIAAEAATLWGGVFLWTRTPSWRPAYTLVDEQQVDYAWITEDDDGRFDADKLAEIRRQHQG